MAPRRWRPLSAACCVALLAGACALLAPCALAQGVRDAESDRAGATDTPAGLPIGKWQAVKKDAASKWSEDAWNKGGRSAQCASRKTDERGSVCGVDVSSAEDKAALLMATSPSSYDLRNPDHNGGFVAAPAPRDQYDCYAAVAMAVAAAADAAVSKATGRSNALPLVSARHLFFCSAPDDTGNAPDCNSGWDVAAALGFLGEGVSLPADRCLPFGDSDFLTALPDDQTCIPTCRDVVAGRFSYTKKVPLTNPINVQEHIRRYGGVVSAMYVPWAFQSFFKNPANRMAVWTKDVAPDQRDRDNGFKHVVALVGYNNTGDYWLVQSSWGKKWGDNGVARVKYGILGLANVTTTYGVIFTPGRGEGVAPRAGDITDDPALKEGCQWFNVKRTTYLSNVAFEAGVDVEDIIRGNAGRLNSLGGWLRRGQRLMVCNATPSPPPSLPQEEAAGASGPAATPSSVPARAAGNPRDQMRTGGSASPAAAAAPSYPRPQYDAGRLTQQAPQYYYPAAVYRRGPEDTADPGSVVGDIGTK